MVVVVIAGLQRSHRSFYFIFASYHSVTGLGSRSLDDAGKPCEDSGSV